MGNVNFFQHFDYVRPSDSSSNINHIYANVPKSHKLTKHLPNPGLFEHFDKVWEFIGPKRLNGFQVVTIQKFNDQIDLQSCFSIDPLKPTTRNAVSSKLIVKDTFPLVCCKMEKQGWLPSPYFHRLVECSDIHGEFRFFDKYFEVPRLAVNFKADWFSTTLMGQCVNTNFGFKGFLALQFLQSITKNFDFGFDMRLKHNDRDQASLALVGRYSNWNNGFLTVKMGMDTTFLHYCLEVSPTFQTGFGIESSLLQEHFVGTMICRKDLPECEAVFKGSVDTNLNVFVEFRKMLDNCLSFSIALGYNNTFRRITTGLGFEARM